ncbi:MAG: biotin--[acetyl-CoA-carboxylase] ligase, partial [Phycisphaeraceae bacterium]
NLELETAFMRRFHFDITDSTSTQAAALAQRYPGEPLLITAAQQTTGRGRTGRPWQSPLGGAWFTVVWPTTAAPTTTAIAPLVTGLAVLETVSRFQEQFRSENLKLETWNLKLKWPNDILLRDHKLAGILCEQHLKQSAAPHTILLGVGINANLETAALGENLRRPAIALREVCGAMVNIQDLIETCATAIAEAMHRLERDGVDAATMQRINAALAWRGQQVALRRGVEQIEGILHSVDHAGRALIGDGAYEAGELEPIEINAANDRP